MPITGRTRLLGILADPIAQVRAPEVFNALFAERGIDAVFVPFHLGSRDLAAAWPAFKAMQNLGGLIATVPHKAACATLCDALEPAGRMIGAVNTIRREPDGRMTATMFDGDGFVAGLRAEGHEPRGKRVLLLGAGGAGSAVAFALAAAGVARLALANRTRGKVERLAAEIRNWFPDAPVVVGDADPTNADIVVNTTSLGMNEGDPLPIAVETIPPAALVAEIIMKPATTPLLAAAEACGNPIHRGRHMLDQQIPLMADFLKI